jgi:hypothetical protein
MNSYAQDLLERLSRTRDRLERCSTRWVVAATAIVALAVLLGLVRLAADQDEVAVALPEPVERANATLSTLSLALTSEDAEHRPNR